MAITKYPAALYGATVSAGAAANTPGAYVELAASLGTDIVGFWLTAYAITPNRDWLVNIATGAAGAEVDAVSNLMIRANATLNAMGVYVPLAVASGTRLSVNCQQASGSGNLGIAIQVVSGTGSAVPTTYGATPATSRGTSIDPGATINTKGAYSEITPATTSACDWVIVMVSTSGNNFPTSGATFSLDLATGAAGAETVVLPDVTFVTNNWPIPCVFSFPLSIGSGTRLAARAASSTNDAADRLFSVVVLAVTNSGLNGGGGGGGGETAYPFVG